MQALLDTALSLMTFEALILMAAGCVLAMVMGALPGLSGTEALLILLPFTFNMPLEQSMLILASAYAASYVGGALTSIVFGIPGSSTNLATVLDGHPLHKQGRTIFAVNLAAICSGLGALFSLVVVVALIPVMQPLALLFGPAEWFLFVIFGLVVLAFSNESNFLRVLMSGALGLLVATIGQSVVSGTPRFAFGMTDLWSGVPIIAAFIGLYPLTDAIDLARGGGVQGDSAEADPVVLKGLRQKGQLADAFRAALRHADKVGISAFTGWFVGVLPGVGASLASVLGYLVVRLTSRNQDNFGRGDVRGLIGSETANNASVGGALIPALALGIPGSLNTAILLSVLMINGVQPGTNIFSERVEALWSVLLGVALATLLSCAIVVIGGWRLSALIAKVPPRATAPAIVLIGCLSLLLARGNANDLFIAAALTVVGLSLKRFRFSRLAFVIALVLGPIVESSFFQAVAIGRGSYTIFFASPVSLTLWFLIAVCFGMHLKRVVFGQSGPKATLAAERKMSDG
jgi:putative tricarboxylic transport membrane protein